MQNNFTLKKMRALIPLFILFSNVVIAQENNIAHFSIWKLKEGLEQKFETGYKQHLLWHKANGDKWSWYGWYIISGSRAGLFVDATFNHNWSDFNSPVNPSGDGADNQLHTVPFADFQMAFKVAKIKQLSSEDSAVLKSKYLRFVTLSVNDITSALKIIEQLKENYNSKYLFKNFQTYKMIDGGNINQIILLLGFANFTDYGKTDRLAEDISSIENSLKMKVITAINSETLLYKADMSLFAE